MIKVLPNVKYEALDQRVKFETNLKNPGNKSAFKINTVKFHGNFSETAGDMLIFLFQTVDVVVFILCYYIVKINY